MAVVAEVLHKYLNILRFHHCWKKILADKLQFKVPEINRPPKCQCKIFRVRTRQVFSEVLHEYLSPGRCTLLHDFVFLILWLVSTSVDSREMFEVIQNHEALLDDLQSDIHQAASTLSDLQRLFENNGTSMMLEVNQSNSGERSDAGIISPWQALWNHTDHKSKNTLIFLGLLVASKERKKGCNPKANKWTKE